MFVVAVTFFTTPEGYDRFVRLVTENAGRSLSDEPGCHRFDVCLSDARPNEVFLYELYDDEAAFEVHKTMPHYLTFSDGIADLVTGKEVRTFTLAGT